MIEQSKLSDLQVTNRAGAQHLIVSVAPKDARGKLNVHVCTRVERVDLALKKCCHWAMQVSAPQAHSPGAVSAHPSWASASLSLRNSRCTNCVISRSETRTRDTQQKERFCKGFGIQVFAV